MDQAALYQDIYNYCCREAQKACDLCKPTPMLVGTPKTFLGDELDMTKPVEFVAGGVCGFAGVRIHKATGSFARWLVKNNLGSVSGYYGGVDIKARPDLAGPLVQSMELNEAYADRWAQAFNELNLPGAEATAWSRID